MGGIQVKLSGSVVYLDGGAGPCSGAYGKIVTEIKWQLRC